MAAHEEDHDEEAYKRAFNLFNQFEYDGDVVVSTHEVVYRPRERWRIDIALRDLAGG